MKPTHLRCYTCAAHFVVMRPGPLHRFQAGGPYRCINTAGTDLSSRSHTANVPAGVLCGAVLAWSSAAVPPGTPTVQATDLAFVRVFAGDLPVGESKVAELEAEIHRLRELHETYCPGRVQPWREDQGRKSQPCGGYIGHPGNCAPYWAPMSGWRVA